ncbi:RHS repeat-associated core domain-containing protein, partial [Lysinibacillus sphaericus]|uniref:RHS repeat-associated core domain-containing protein n=1 Tax=Lysinibacillus sphaericus TaxID=1421 RepID=UPI001CA4BBE7
ALDSLVTWVFNDGFVPSAKITSEGNYSIISDYLGTPVEAYDEQGHKVWSAELDVYGRVKEFTGEKDFIPFRYQGQYEDLEIGLYYNRFRYYDPAQGNYTQVDPIGLAGGNPTLYGYVENTNILLDPFGLNSITFKGDISPYQTRIDVNFTGRPDPQYSIDSKTFSSGKTTSNGGIRNTQQFWEQWSKLNPQTLSKSNQFLVENYSKLKVSPRIDDEWIKHFPEHAGYKGNVLIHHHVNFGRYAIPVPGETHVGSGGVWHCK